MKNLSSIPGKEKHYHSYLVFVFTIVWSVVTGAVVSIGFYFFPENWLRWASFLAVSLLICVANLTLNRLGYTRAASWSLTVMVWLYITIPCYSAGGINAPGIISQMSVILMAGILLGWRGGLVFGLLSIGADFMFAYLEMNGQLPAPTIVHNPITRWIGAIIPFGTLLSLQYYATRHLRATVAALQNEIYKREKAEAAKDETLYNLEKRVKEQETLYTISRLLQDESALHDNLFHKIAAVLPSGWLYPDVTAACVCVGGTAYATDNYKPTPYYLRGETRTAKDTPLSIEVVYLQEMPQKDEGPFLKEERNLINALLEMLKKDLEEREQSTELRDYKFALDMASNVAITGIDGCFTFVNENFSRISGYGAGELLGKHHGILSSGHHPQAYFDDLRIAMQDGKPFRGEFCNEAKDGTLYWVDSTIVPFLDEHGNVYQYLSINHDITERKAAEDKIRQSEERYRSIITVSNAGAWEYNWDTDQVWYSAEYFSMLGINRPDGAWDESMETTWIERLHPADRERATQTFAEYLMSDSKGLYENFFRMRHENGDWVWIWSRGRRLPDVDGNLTNVTIGSHIDITERINTEEKIKQSEQLLKKITSHIPCNTYMFEIEENGQSKLLFMNRGVEAFNHNYSVDDLFDDPRKLREKLHEDDKVKFNDAMKEAYQTHSVISVQYRIPVNGHIRWRWFQAVPEKSPDGKVVWYGATSDITPLVEYTASIEQIIFDISHVIRRPVSSMIGITKLITESDLSEKEIKDFSQNLHLISKEVDDFIQALNCAYSEKKKNNQINIDFSSSVDKRVSLFK